MRNLFKEKKAITLIALIITIVVLIILAGVLINISLGNNGLFNKAKTAKEMYTNAQDYEQTQIAKYSNEIDSYVGGGRNTYNLGKYVLASIVSGSNNYHNSTGTSSDNEYFTVTNSNTNENHIDITVNKNMSIKIMLQDSSRGTNGSNTTIEINDSEVYSKDTVNIIYDEFIRNVSAGDTIKITHQKPANSQRALAILLICNNEL